MMEMDEMTLKLDSLIEELATYEGKYVNLSAEIISADNQNMYTMDLLSTAIANRAIQLVNGFCLLVRDDNYLCAIPLIRLQLDNALRFYAFFLVKSRDNLFSHFSDGKPINKYRDSKNNFLTDNYLATNLDKLFKGVLDTYKNTSSHIHLSDQHLLATRLLRTDKSKPMRIGVGPKIDAFSVELKINFASTMNEVSRLVLIILNQWKLEKEGKS
ncbi:hypothetical protein KXD93_20870 [Mucilaginibacter sp. BJC16-A38]|uniref:hypothetical protein n=1 Tax=Mucilaginibacter phenanthrenivorans TaxID=1234842 RepID=UPI0021570C45|nr:hypothetical protein [Mucilaginibacter phenanthrenivorans]MCR8560117.1 hypothetical protein [Mucilaginibacter phenanthrenivorans]